MPYTIRRALPEDVQPALDLALRVFTEYEAPSYPAEGAASFRADIEWKAANKELYASKQRVMFVAAANKKIVGVVESNRPCHVNMAFVDGAYHRKGIAAALMNELIHTLKSRGDGYITVNSSPYGLPFYLSLGFEPTGGEQQKDGLIFTPLKLSISTT